MARVAQGPLAAALDTQLASAQPADAATRIGLSFAAADGRLCRTFDSAALSGLACRGGEGWQLMMTAAGGGGRRPIIARPAAAIRRCSRRRRS